MLEFRKCGKCGSMMPNGYCSDCAIKSSIEPRKAFEKQELERLKGLLKNTSLSMDRKSTYWCRHPGCRGHAPGESGMGFCQPHP